MNEKNDSRWWEFYGIRYAQGTVVGALIVFFLFSQSPALKGILFIPTEPKDFGIAHLVLLGIYGLAFCYIASAPILIMHAARGLLFQNTGVQPGLKERAIRHFLILTLPILISFSVFMAHMSTDKALVATLFSIILSLQMWLLYEIFTFKWLETISYNLKIISKRRQTKHADYIESYRHLREHGNSFFIVFLQFILATPIFVFTSNATKEDAVFNMSLIVILWVIPPSLIWFFGNKLENHLRSI